MTRRLVRNLVALLLGLAFGAAMHEALAVKAGAVVAYNLSECPSGWSPVTASAGRVVIGVGTLAPDSYSLGDMGGEARHTLTVEEMPAHTHARNSAGTLERPVVGDNGTGSTGNSSGSRTFQQETHTGAAGGGAPHENRPPYLALLYCSLDEDEQGDSGAAQTVILCAALAMFGIGFLTGQS